MTPSQKLLLNLLHANSEAEVTALVEKDGEMNRAENWRTLDNRENNYNTVRNQSSNGAKAATELMTNMVDAVLMKRCHEERIDPKGAGAPPDMYKAVDWFVFPLNGGKISQADKPQLKKFADENLIIGITGGRTAGQLPCYTFCDNGEGQHPEDFATTFLSFSDKNKSEIPFVQGKYNMGSSGVLNFCGNKKYKLIVSRRYDEKGDWGWTLIRMKGVQSGMNNFEYFSPGGEIMRFSSSERLIPFKTKQGELYDKFSLQTGTVVKLYDYFLGKKHAGFKGSQDAFNENMVETILPFRIWDFRWNPEKGRTGGREVGMDPRPFNGMEFVLLRGQGEQDDAEGVSASRKIDIDHIIHNELGEITISAVIMGASAEREWYKKSNARVFHHVNGQVQFKETRSFLTNCGFQALGNKVVIFVDASKLKDGVRQEIWKGDRENIIETPMGERYKNAVKESIKNSPDLKKLRHEVINEEMKKVSEDSSRHLVKELIKVDPNFKFLLDGSTPKGISVGGAETPTDPKRRQDLKRNPTYIILKSRGDYDIRLPVNKGRPIVFDTDADDSFVSRDDNPGRLTISSEEMERKFSWRVNLRNGVLVLFLKPDRDQVSVGEQYKFKVCLESDDTSHQPVCLGKEITITIAEKETQRRKNPNPRPSPPKPVRPEAETVDLPPHILLTKNGKPVMNNEATTKWADFREFDCRETDGGYARDMGDGKFQYYINYDNVFFQAYLKGMKDGKSAAKQKYVFAMRVMLLGLERGIAAHNLGGLEGIEKIRRAAAHGAARVALTLCDQIPQTYKFADAPDESDSAPEDDGDDS